MIEDNFKRQGFLNPDNEAKYLIEIMSLISHLSTIPIGLFFGWLSDRFKAWKLLLLNVIGMASFLALFIIFIETNNLAFKIAYVGMNIFN